MKYEISHWQPAMRDILWKSVRGGDGGGGTIEIRIIRHIFLGHVFYSVLSIAYRIPSCTCRLDMPTAPLNNATLHGFAQPSHSLYVYLSLCLPTTLLLCLSLFLFLCLLFFSLSFPVVPSNFSSIFNWNLYIEWAPSPPCLKMIM